MCHPWPIGRAGSRVQNFALKCQIFLPNKPLRTLRTFFLRPILGMRSARKKWQKIEILCPRIDCKKTADFSVNWFSAELHYTNCVPDFCWFCFFFGGTSDLCLSRSNLLFLCSGLLLIQWFSLGFLLIFLFRRSSASQNVRLSSVDLGFVFQRKSINLVTHDYPLIPCCIFISQCEISPLPAAAAMANKLI